MSIQKCFLFHKMVSAIEVFAISVCYNEVLLWDYDHDSIHSIKNSVRYRVVSAVRHIRYREVPLYLLARLVFLLPYLFDLSNFRNSYSFDLSSSKKFTDLLYTTNLSRLRAKSQMFFSIFYKKMLELHAKITRFVAAALSHYSVFCHPAFQCLMNN